MLTVVILMAFWQTHTRLKVNKLKFTCIYEKVDISKKEVLYYKIVVGNMLLMKCFFFGLTIFTLH